MSREVPPFDKRVLAQLAREKQALEAKQIIEIEAELARLARQRR